jgi:AcrR family transcriptional regulator
MQPRTAYLESSGTAAVEYHAAVAQPAAKPRRRMKAAARREQLIDVTMELIAADGFPAVSIQAVAQRAGVSRPVVYEHFASLHGLLEAVVERETERARDQVSQTALGDLSDGDPIELMLDSLGKYLAAVESHPVTWQLVLTPPEGAPELLRTSIRRGRAMVLESITSAVQLGSLTRSYSQDPELTARMLSAMADEYARLVLLDPRRYPPERLLLHAGWWLTQMFG